MPVTSRPCTTEVVLFSLKNYDTDDTIAPLRTAISVQVDNWSFACVIDSAVRNTCKDPASTTNVKQNGKKD